MRKIFSFFAVACLCCLTLASGRAEARTISVRSDHLRCIVANSDRYLASGDATVIIIPAACPRLPTVSDLGDFATNQVGDVIPINEQSRVIVLRRNELLCLTRAFRNLRLGGRPRLVRWETRTCRLS